jgi:hypothetical protein
VKKCVKMRFLRAALAIWRRINLKDASSKVSQDLVYGKISSISLGSIPRSLLRSGVVGSAARVPSFPDAFSGNAGEFRTGPPIKTFGGDDLGKGHPRSS